MIFSIPYCCPNESGQLELHKMTQIYHLLILEARSPPDRSHWGGGWGIKVLTGLSSFPEVLQENLLSCLVQLLRAPGVHQLEVVCLHTQQWPGEPYFTTLQHSLFCVSHPVLSLYCLSSLNHLRYSLYGHLIRKLNFTCTLNPTLPCSPAFMGSSIGIRISLGGYWSAYHRVISYHDREFF